MPFVYQTICFDDVHTIDRAVDIFSPAKPSQELSFFFVHGGGWRHGSRVHMHALMHHLTNLGHVCASTDYRLKAADATIQLGDVRQGYHLFREYLKARQLPQRVVAYGSSAGAHLAALLALAKPGACGEALPPGEADVPPVALAVQSMPVTFEPWDEIFPVIWSAMQNIAGEPYQAGSQRYRQLSPIEHLHRDAPAVLLMEAENEHMFPLDLSDVFVQRGRSLGVKVQQIVYKRAEHGFFYDVTRAVQKKAMEDMLAFVRQV